nr:2-amino-4-hydroxy-6-hydroxymethyldihydropteridine diphosphokinase [Ottowia thiooxydans]
MPFEAGAKPHQRIPITAYVALGANLGDAKNAVLMAMNSLGSLPYTQETARSSLYRTAPIDSSGPEYINAVAEISTCLTAPDLLRELQMLELAAGRERPYRNAPRTLDLDLLVYGEACIQSPLLTLPHPRMNEREFVLVPLAEIAPTRVGAQLLAAVAGQGIERID